LNERRHDDMSGLITAAVSDKAAEEAIKVGGKFLTANHWSVIFLGGCLGFLAYLAIVVVPQVSTSINDGYAKNAASLERAIDSIKAENAEWREYNKRVLDLLIEKGSALLTPKDIAELNL
jgi:hypothetical protein